MSYRSAVLAGSLLVLFTVPPALFYFHLASSYSLGILFWSIGSLGIAVITPGYAVKTRGALVLVIFDLLIVAIWTMRFRLSGEANGAMITKPMESLVLLNIMIAAAGGTARIATRNSSEAVKRILDRLVWLFLLIGGASLALEFIGRQIGDWEKPMLPFSEPSHFAIAFAPLSLFAATTWPNGKFLITLGVIFAVIALKSNATLLALALLLIAIRFGPVKVVLVLLGVAISLPSLSFLSPYFLSRIRFWQGDNLSALVYLQGLQIIDFVLGHSHLFGLGFQELGLAPLPTNAGYRIMEATQGKSLNIKDGGFVLVKIIAEFGWLGVVAAIALTYRMALSMLALRVAYKSPMKRSSVWLFAHCCILGYSLEFFVRGIGYISIGSCLLIMGLLIASSSFGERATRKGAVIEWPTSRYRVTGSKRCI